MKALTILLLIISIGLLTSCQASPKKPPTQVVYRFDDHRYLELKGFYCEGELWYVDNKMNIRSQVHSQFYRVFTKKYIHPSERYIAITSYGAGGFSISKDYGRTWEGASFAPGGGADRFGKRIPRRKDRDGYWIPAGEYTHPIREDIISFTVVNDQGFMLTKWGDIYMSSKPFDDPRLEPGGSGIDYISSGEKHHLFPRDVGSRWGKDYLSWVSIQGDKPWKVFAFYENFQGIPNKIPKVKNYRGWDRMRCDPSLGL
ncbi:hypothetical protein GW590_06110 [Rahnella sp. SAP-1]|uniref:Tli3-like domain-containing protein n=1 Tax=Rouxiella aceris TaxID=2703884 RepID=A0A848MH64_9GAMM|nr:hypothetical protein [Rouxiella aceris]NMP26440.1 hypothetical protein [Rouxiella aceris]